MHLREAHIGWIVLIAVFVICGTVLVALDRTVAGEVLIGAACFGFVALTAMLFLNGTGSRSTPS